MKKSIFILIFFCISLTLGFSAENKVTEDTYDYDQIVTSVRGVQQPLIINDCLIFTVDSSARNVGIAFDFENFKQIHAFSLRKIYDFEGEQTSSWYFYVLKIPKKTTRISYKLIIDGLWTSDPVNPKILYDEINGVQLSYVDILQRIESITEKNEQGFTKFICNSKPGQKIRLAGNFTNWDSWIYEMTEVSPGKYEISLPLPAGTYYYAYFDGLKRFIDDTNPNKAYTADGKMASKLVVNN